MAGGAGEGRYAASMSPRNSMFNDGGVPKGNRIYTEAQNTGKSERGGVILRAVEQGSAVDCGHRCEVHRLTG